ncbi:MAG: zinc-binding dehydrogenase [Candidatus Rokubacteria bacterium]|nr:zinc-binding dehydrogenase [Candidatus Rokubacteria bacterium]
MKAVYLTEHGGVEVLTYGDLPDPVPGGGEVLVRVRACGVNHVDLWLRKGLPFMQVPFPFVPGADIAGEVAAIGPATAALPVGTRVLVNPGVSCGQCERCLTGWDNLCNQYRLIGEPLPGGYAELVKVPAQNLVALPEGMPFETAACLPAAFGTAWNMVFEKAKLEAEEWVLIQAAGSGVGSAAIQLARMVGAHVITTAGSDEKVEKAKAVGAHYAINYTTRDFLHEVRRITKKRGVDVVIEHIGGEIFERSLLCLATGGRLVTCGATSGYLPKTNLRHVFFRNLRILGATTGSKGRLFRILQLAHEGKLRPVVDRVLPLREARVAHQLLEDRQQFGKVILVPE